MVLTIDFLGDGKPLVWSLEGSVDEPEWLATRATEYRPTVYAVAARGMQHHDPDRTACVDDLADLHEDLVMHPAVENLSFEWKNPGFRFADQPVLRIEVDRMETVREIARFIEDRGPPGRVPYRAFNVDFSPEFRFCLETDTDPAPSRPPRRLRLDLPREATANEDLTDLEMSTVDGADRDRHDGRNEADATVDEVLRALRRQLREFDPDILRSNGARSFPWSSTLLTSTASTWACNGSRRACRIRRSPLTRSSPANPRSSPTAAGCTHRPATTSRAVS
jgi:DNA polymerase I